MTPLAAPCAMDARSAAAADLLDALAELIRQYAGPDDDRAGRLARDADRITAIVAGRLSVARARIPPARRPS